MCVYHVAWWDGRPARRCDPRTSQSRRGRFYFFIIVVIRHSDWSTAEQFRCRVHIPLDHVWRLDEWLPHGSCACLPPPLCCPSLSAYLSVYVSLCVCVCVVVNDVNSTRSQAWLGVCVVGQWRHLLSEQKSHLVNCTLTYVRPLLAA